MTPNFFTTNSPYLNHPLLTAERTRAEVDFALAQLEVATGARILDMGCGFGRHTIALAGRGYAAVGVDPSAAMIVDARRRANEAGVSAELITADGTNWTTSQPFDAALCLFTTLGQISAAGDNRAILHTMRQALRPSARVIIEVPQRAVTVANLRPHDRFGSDTHYTNIERNYVAADQAIRESFTLVSPDSERSFLLSYRLFDPTELRALMTAAGLVPIAEFSDYTGASLTDASPMMIIVGAAA